MEIKVSADERACRVVEPSINQNVSLFPKTKKKILDASWKPDPVLDILCAFHFNKVFRYKFLDKAFPPLNCNFVMAFIDWVISCRSLTPGTSVFLSYGGGLKWGVTSNWDDQRVGSIIEWSLRKAVIVLFLLFEASVHRIVCEITLLSSHRHLQHTTRCLCVRGLPTPFLPVTHNRGRGLTTEPDNSPGLEHFGFRRRVRVRSGFSAGCSAFFFFALSSRCSTWQDLAEVVVRGGWWRK